MEYWIKNGRSGWIIVGFTIYICAQITWFFSLAFLSETIESYVQFTPMYTLLLLFVPPLTFLILYFSLGILKTKFGVWNFDGRESDVCGPCGKYFKDGKSFYNRKLGRVLVCDKCLIKHVRSIRFLWTLIIIGILISLFFIGGAFFDPNLGSSSTTNTYGSGSSIVIETRTTSSPYLESIAGTWFAWLVGTVVIVFGLVMICFFIRGLLSPISEEEIENAGLDIIEKRKLALTSR